MMLQLRYNTGLMILYWEKFNKETQMIEIIHSWNEDNSHEIWQFLRLYWKFVLIAHLFHVAIYPTSTNWKGTLKNTSIESQFKRIPTFTWAATFPNPQFFLCECKIIMWWWWLNNQKQVVITGQVRIIGETVKSHSIKIHFSTVRRHPSPEVYIIWDKASKEPDVSEKILLDSRKDVKI